MVYFTLSMKIDLKNLYPIDVANALIVALYIQEWLNAKVLMLLYRLMNRLIHHLGRLQFEIFLNKNLIGCHQ